MDLDANYILTVKAEESRSGAIAKIIIKPADCKNLLIKN